MYLPLILHIDDVAMYLLHLTHSKKLKTVHAEKEKKNELLLVNSQINQFSCLGH